MLDLLAARHSAINKFGFPRWVYAEKVYDYRWGSEVDAVALDGLAVPHAELPAGPDGSWHRLPLRPDVHGFEVKVSRSDWLRELRTEGGKSHPWRSRCSHWWIVVPDRGIVRDGELPDGWGLLVGTRQLRAVVKAARDHDPHEFGHATYTLVARAALRTASRLRGRPRDG